MVLRNAEAVAFSMPGGESWGVSRGRPVDLVHLSRQTMGDRDLEREVLRLFVQQAVIVRDRIVNADLTERMRLAHTLKGSARSVGAFGVAECMVELEKRPDSKPLMRRLAEQVDEVSDFVAAISR